MKARKIARVFVSNVNHLSEGEFLRFDIPSEVIDQSRIDYVVIFDTQDNAPVLGKVDALSLELDDNGCREVWIKVA